MNINTTVFALLLISAFCLSASSQTYNNYQKDYVLTSQTEGRIEAGRTHRMVLCDYQPSGLYVRKSERVGIDVTGLPAGYTLSSMVGFKPMWGNRNNTQEVRLREGGNTVTASQDGILSFIFVKTEGYDTKPATVRVHVTGGKAFPLFQLNRSNLLNWQNDLKTMTDARFVQLISDKVLITIPYKDYLRTPITNIQASFRTIHQVIDWEDELAGFDSSSPENMRTRNRLHYMVDLYSTPKEGEDYYMYALDYVIGMKRDNFTDLTEKLSKEWGIWHETGHTQQQETWLWGSITEISVNMFSLYVQEKFGLPTRLGTIEGDETLTTFAKARKYVEQPKKNYLGENEADYNELFSKLVMFHQLKSVYGWDAIKKLHQYFRKQPYAEIEGETDADKADKFVYAMCIVTKNNLIPFFKKWGLNVGAATANRINGLKYSYPSVDPSKIFQ
jgi:hypothetical protein